MRRPRRLVPGQLYDVTVRCNRSEFRLLPTRFRTENLMFFLAKAKQRYKGIRISCVAQMSNHLHMVVEDGRSELSAFMRDFLGHLAKSINRLDKVRGHVFERRFTAIPIVDLEAAVRRIAYAVTNPVEAGLVRRFQEWGGLCTWYGRFQPTTLKYFHEGKYRRALKEAKKTGALVDRADFEEFARLELDPIDGLDPDVVQNAIAARQKQLQAKQQGKVMGMERVLQQRSFDRPKWSKRSKMPLCLYTTKDAKDAFLDGWFTFVDRFREASEAFRSGVLDVLFPAYSFRPSIPAG